MSLPSGALLPDSAQLVVPVTLIGPAEAVDLTNAIVGDPALERTVDGATTLTLDVLDWDRSLTKSGAFTTRSWAVLDDLRFELVAVRRTGDVVQLTFEDAVVVALRRHTTPRVFNAGRYSREGIAQALGAEAGVTVLVDPAYRDIVGDVVTRNSDEDGTAKIGKAASKDTSWSLLSALAGPREGRCFSDGRRVLLGGDDWLMSRMPAVSIAEHVDAVESMDYELDISQATASAEVEVDADRWTLPPGLAVKITDPGPHTGTWLLAKFARPLNATRGTLTLERARPTLLEPVPSNDGAGEAGELDFLDDSALSAETPVKSLRAAERTAGPLGRFLDFALQQQGKKYVWGASGPNTFDCSGLVQQAAAAAGYRFPKPCRSQLQLAQQGAAKMLTVKDALATRGALLFRVQYPGAGDHVAISLGNGTTMEARGAQYGCGIFDRAAERRWNAGAMLTFTGRSSISSSGPR